MPQDAHANCRFYVEIGGKKEAVFTELSGLQMETETMEYAEGGNNDYAHILPGRAKIGRITLKGGMTTSNDLFNWCMEVVQGKIKRQNITVSMFDAKGTPVRQWKFNGAYPVKWIGPQFAANGTAAAVETLELAHAGLLP